MVGASSRLLIILFHHRPSALLRLAPRNSHSLTSPLPPLSTRILPLSSTNSIFAIKSYRNFQARTTCNTLPENNHIPADNYFVPLSHPWPEWSRLLEYLSVAGYFNGNSNKEDEFVAKEMEFMAAARSCLAFARDRPDILGWLPMNDIQVLIDDGTPFLFKNAPETERRMRFFLESEESKQAGTVDVMKYILSYASNPIIYPERNIKEATESSVRNLIRDIVNLSGMGPARQFQAVGKHEQTSRNRRPKLWKFRMKNGDWICPRCNFGNYRRNTKCLECEELRPQRKSPGEWDCPRCNFFNYRDNGVCYRCECRRPGETPFPSSLGQANASSDYGDNGTPDGNNFRGTETSVNHNLDQFVDSPYTKDVDEADKLELHDVPELTTAISDEDFPQIMPMCKGEDRFVVNNKDQPLTSTYERQEAMEQGGNNNFVLFVPFPPDYFAKKDNQQQHQRTNDICESSNNGTHDMNLVQETRNPQTGSTNNLDLRSSIGNRDPLSQQTPESQNQTRPKILNVGQQTEESQNVRTGWTEKSLEGSAVKEADPLDMSEEAKAERWFRRIAQIKDISELSQIPDEDFPSIMPIRKGVNRFVVSKRKTPLKRRLTSHYRIFFSNHEL